MDNKRIKYDTILITGGEGGIGKVISNHFLRLGAKVIVTTTKKKLTERNFKKKIYSSSSKLHLSTNKGS